MSCSQHCHVLSVTPLNMQGCPNACRSSAMHMQGFDRVINRYGSRVVWFKGWSGSRAERNGESSP